MFFIFAKVVGFLIIPSNVIAVLALIGAVLWVIGYARFATRLMVLSAVLLALCGFSPLGAVLLLPLEERFAAPKLEAAPDGAVILAGMFNLRSSQRRGVAELNDAADRITVIAGLARRYPYMRVVFSGGSGELFQGSLKETDLAAKMFADFGIASDRIILEAQSRDTAESAAYSKAAANPKPGERWLLITSASHMPRSIGAFRQVGFQVQPYPVDWKTGGGDLARMPPSVRAGLLLIDTAAHEWIGLVTYWLAGRTSEFFPAPR